LDGQNGKHSQFINQQFEDSLPPQTMGVATHLGIDLCEYDARIRTFVPDYDQMRKGAFAVLMGMRSGCKLKARSDNENCSTGNNSGRLR
jgi:hypothetical protein